MADNITIINFLNAHAGEIIIGAGSYISIISIWFIRLLRRQSIAETEISNLKDRHTELKESMETDINEIKTLNIIEHQRIELHTNTVIKVMTKQQEILIKTIDNRFDDLKDIIKASRK